MDMSRLVSRISAVTVFTSGALVTRSVDLATIDGRPQTVRLSGLPLCLDDGSLRVRVVDGSVIAGDIAVALEPMAADTALPPPDDAELVAARLAETRARVQVELCDAQLAQLDGITIPERPRGVRGAVPTSSPTDARLALLAFRRERSDRLIAERERLREEHRIAAERLADLEAKAEIASSARQAREHQLTKTAVITLRWNGDGPAGTLLIDYLVPGARWVPSYTIRLDRAMTAAAIAVRGSVCQRTGEDWLGARLTLSTADALAWYELPELASLRIGRRQPPVHKTGWRPPPQGALELYADFDAALQRQASPPEPQDKGDRTKDRSYATADIRQEAKKEARRPMPARAVGAMAPMAKSAPASMSPPASAPVVQAAPAPERLRRQGLHRPGDVGAVADADVSYESAASFGAGGDASVERDEPAPSEPDHPADDLLAYRRLRMAPPEDHARGRLKPAAAGESYRSLFAASRITVSIAVEQVIAVAMEQATHAGYTNLPPRCRIPSVPQYAYSYPAEGPANVPSDGAWHAVGLSERSAPTALEHVVVPRESRDVFRVAQLTNPFDTPLLDGPADVYAGDDYLMTADVPLTVVGGVLALGLGVEQGISVARNSSFDEGSAGMLGGSLTLTHTIVIDLANKLRAAVMLEVRERLPIAAPGQDDCKIKVVQATPAWEEYRQMEQHLEGGHRWRVRLAPGAAQKLTAVYVVTIPAKSEIAGGNRREA